MGAAARTADNKRHDNRITLDLWAGERAAFLLQDQTSVAIPFIKRFRHPPVLLLKHIARSAGITR